MRRLSDNGILIAILFHTYKKVLPLTRTPSQVISYQPIFYQKLFLMEKQTIESHITNNKN